LACVIEQSRDDQHNAGTVPHLIAEQIPRFSGFSQKADSIVRESITNVPVAARGVPGPKFSRILINTTKSAQTFQQRAFGIDSIENSAITWELRYDASNISPYWVEILGDESTAAGILNLAKGSLEVVGVEKVVFRLFETDEDIDLFSFTNDNELMEGFIHQGETYGSICGGLVRSVLQKCIGLLADRDREVFHDPAVTDSELAWAFGSSIHRIRSQLNGSHGEFTASDDVPSTKRQRRKQNQQVVRNETKNAVRRAGVAVASSLTGREGAKDLYKLASLYAPKGSRTARKAKANPERSINLGKLVLSKCASNFLEVHMNPFSLDCRNICLPRAPSIPSMKAVGFIRGTAFVGTQGVGFIELSPCICNDYPAVFYTTAAYAFSVTSVQPYNMTPLAAIGGSSKYPAGANFTGLPFTKDNLLIGSADDQNSKFISGRIVACSMKVKYIGTKLNQSGQYYAYADPLLGNVGGEPAINTGDPNTGYTLNDLGAKISTEITSVGDGYAEVMPLPVRTSLEEEYPNITFADVNMLYPWCNGQANATDSTSTGAPNSVIMFTGVAGSPYWFEAIVHVEYTGPGIPSYNLTDTESDAMGYDICKTILSRARDACAADPQLTFRRAVPMMMAKYKVVMGRGLRSEQR